MKKASFEELLLRKENNVLKASVLSGYSRTYYYRTKQQPKAVTCRNSHSSDLTEAAALEAIEKVALEYPSYGVRRITAMLHRSGGIQQTERRCTVC